MVVSAESLFRDHFFRLYPDDAKSDLARARSTDANPAKNPSILAHLGEAAERFVENAALSLGLRDEDLALDFTDASVHRLSAALTKERRDRLAANADDAGESELFSFVVHGAAYVGACIVRAHGGAWAVRRPLWESLVVLESRAGVAELPVFHWWLKSLADDALVAGDASGATPSVRATLADRYRAHVEVPTTSIDALPILAPMDRKLPRLSKVRYDVFYKYIRANLPELRDVGAAFPSPERFEAYGFKHLSFTLVEDGRMLVVHGPNAHGLHAFWLGKSGFEKSAFWPCDAFPEPLLRPSGDGKLEVVMSVDGAVRSFEMLAWGP